MLILRIFALITLLGIYACNNKQQPPATAQTTAPQPKNLDTLTIRKLDPNSLIIPGKSIGQTALQEKAEVVTARLGKPDMGDAAMGKALSTWYSKPTASDTSRVNQIRVTSPFFRTLDSIRTGSDWRIIRKKFPEVKKAAAYSLPGKQAKTIIYDATVAGIAFEINPDGKCVAIIIHAPNIKIANTYLPLFTDLERIP